MLAAFAAMPLPDERLMEIRHSPKALGPVSGLSAVLGRNAFERPGDCDQARPRLCGGNWNKSQEVSGAMCLYLTRRAFLTFTSKPTEALSGRRAKTRPGGREWNADCSGRSDGSRDSDQLPVDRRRQGRHYR